MKKIPLLPRYFRWIGVVVLLIFFAFYGYLGYLEKISVEIMSGDRIAQTVQEGLINGADSSIVKNHIESADSIAPDVIEPFYKNMKMFAIYDGQNYFTITQQDMTFTLILILPLLALGLIAFSRNKIEDEMINGIRLYSWSWAIIGLLLFSIITTLFIYSGSYLSFLFFYIHVLLLFYVVIFWVNIWKMNRRLGNEE